MKENKSNWFDDHLIIEGIGLSEKSKRAIKDSIIKKCAGPISKLDRKKKKGAKK
tara:strand:+ start:397 stop:558 length:162 start_codon:yes stop_codon:yes gene_type:complete